MSDFKTAFLFGGAITADIPSTFEDVSTIRQIPSNQEVHLDSAGYTSIVFDLLERIDGDSDEEALRWHLGDVLDDDDNVGGVKVWDGVDEEEGVRLGRMGMGDNNNNKIPVLSLLATSPPGAQQRGRPNEPDFVGIWFVLVRLVVQKTDIVITVNVPHLPGEYVKEEVDLEKGKLGKLLETGRKVRDKVLETLEVKDWGLFVNEEEEEEKE